MWKIQDYDSAMQNRWPASPLTMKLDNLKVAYFWLGLIVALHMWFSNCKCLKCNRFVGYYTLPGESIFLYNIIIWIVSFSRNLCKVLLYVAFISLILMSFSLAYIIPLSLLCVFQYFMTFRHLSDGIKYLKGFSSISTYY